MSSPFEAGPRAASRGSGIHKVRILQKRTDVGTSLPCLAGVGLTRIKQMERCREAAERVSTLYSNPSFADGEDYQEGTPVPRRSSRRSESARGIVGQPGWQAEEGRQISTSDGFFHGEFGDSAMSRWSSRTRPFPSAQDRRIMETLGERLRFTAREEGRRKPDEITAACRGGDFSQS